MSDQTHNYSECRCHDCTTARYRTSFQFQIDSALRPAATESKAEGGYDRDIVRQIENQIADEGNNRFVPRTTEPPQPSVQLCNDTTCGLPKCHAIHGTARGQHTFVEPSVQGEQDEAQPPTYNSALESLLDATKRLSMGKPVRNLDEIIAFAESTLKAPAPSITSQRIAEIAQEYSDCDGSSQFDIKRAIEKALREAGVRVG